MLKAFKTATGTIIGRDHAAKRMNNQDGYAVRQYDDCLVMAVCDGCSSGAYNEVGARWAAQWLARNAGSHLPPGLSNAEQIDGFIFRVSNRLSFELGHLLYRMTGESCDISPEIVRDFALFTMLVCVMTEYHTVIFGIGDGCYRVEEVYTPKTLTLEGEAIGPVSSIRCRDIDSGPSNTPNYIGYRLLSREHRERCGITPESLEPVVYYCGPTERVKGVLLGTDGAVDIDKSYLYSNKVTTTTLQLMQDEKFYKNPSLLGKKLVVLGELNKLLHDDTTIVMTRRFEGG